MQAERPTTEVKAITIPKSFMLFSSVSKPHKRGASVPADPALWLRLSDLATIDELEKRKIIVFQTSFTYI